MILMSLKDRYIVISIFIKINKYNLDDLRSVIYEIIFVSRKSSEPASDGYLDP